MNALQFEQPAMPLFEMAKARRSDPVTSHKAAEYVNLSKIVGEHDKRAYAYLHLRGPSTAKEMEGLRVWFDGDDGYVSHYDLNSTQIARALYRLECAGKVCKTGEKRKTGRLNYCVWKAL